MTTQTKPLKIALVCANFYPEFSAPLIEGAMSVLNSSEDLKNLKIDTFDLKVSGCFEIPLICQKALGVEDKKLNDDSFDGAIALGVLIKGESYHFESVCQSVTQGLMEVMLKCNKPITQAIVMAPNYQIAKQKVFQESHHYGKHAASALLESFKSIEKIEKIKTDL